MGLGDAVQAVLEAHLEASPARFRGIRDGTAADLDLPFGGNALAGRMTDPAFRAGFSKLGPLGLSCDLWCVHPQLGDVADLARAFPGTTIILNHLGSPLGVGRFRDKQDEMLASLEGRH